MNRRGLDRQGDTTDEWKTHELTAGEFYGKLFAPIRSPARLNLKAVRAGIYLSPNVPDLLQVTGSSQMDDVTSVGFNGRCYERVGLLLLSAFFEKHAPAFLDYKCHSIVSPIDLSGAKLLELSEQAVRGWVDVCMGEWFNFLASKKETGKILFRRSMLVTLSSYFLDMGKEESSGHMIAIGMEVKGTDVWLYVFDYRMEEYTRNVHEGRFGKWMTEAVQSSAPYHFCASHGVELNVCYEFVNLKGRLHYGNDFMMCISIAWRVCMYLALGKDPSRIRESEGDFRTTTDNFKHHVFTMINYLYSHKLVVGQADGAPKGCAMVSPEMFRPFFEVSRRTCYLMMVPFVESVVKLPRIYLECMKEHAEEFVRYDLDRGVVTTSISQP